VSLRRYIVLFILLSALIFGLLKWRSAPASSRPGVTPGVIVNKQPMTVTNRRFDSAALPTDMPALNPGESAACESNFRSGVSVGGDTQRTGATQATLTVTHVKVDLALDVIIWLPAAVTQHVVEHEDGHRQISEHYYQIADKLAERIAAEYIGKQMPVTGADLNAASGKALQELGSAIADEYNTQLNPGEAQLRYDAITDHSRNDIHAADAVAQTLMETTVSSER
jgi:hypothetical protein